MERLIIGEGKEHIVYKSHRNGWLLKKPKFLQTLALNVLFDSPSEVIKSEFEVIGDLFTKSGIMIPETKVFKINRGYIIVQREIYNDGSLNTAQVHSCILNSKDRYIYDYYINNADNFKASNGQLYCLDPTLGYARVLDRLGLISYQTQTQMRGILFGKDKLDSRKQGSPGTHMGSV